MSAASALVAQLAAAPVSALHRQRADGSRLIDALYAACSQAAASDDVPGLAGLALPPAAAGGPARSLEDLRARYFAVFECAIALQVGPWLLDYVAEVSGSVVIGRLRVPLMHALRQVGDARVHASTMLHAEHRAEGGHQSHAPAPCAVRLLLHSNNS